MNFECPCREEALLCVCMCWSAVHSMMMLCLVVEVVDQGLVLLLKQVTSLLCRGGGKGGGGHIKTVLISTSWHSQYKVLQLRNEVSVGDSGRCCERMRCGVGMATTGQHMHTRTALEESFSNTACPHPPLPLPSPTWLLLPISLRTSSSNARGTLSPTNQRKRQV